MTETDLRMTLGLNIKRFRTGRGLSQAKLAEKVNLTPNFISELETGKRWISSDTLVKLSEALDVIICEFLQEPEEPSEEMQAFVKKYTTEAEAVVGRALKETLEKLCEQYIREKYGFDI